MITQTSLPTRRIGDLETSALGYGAMVLIGLYGAVDETDGVAVIRRGLDLGVTMVDTSDAYGTDGSNERLVGRALAGRRDQAVIATKWGIVDRAAPGAQRFAEYGGTNEVWVDGRPERARPALETSLRRLGVDAIDLWYLHFPDRRWPIEDTVGAMAELAASGDVRHIGLSNVSADELRRAHAVHPIAAVQFEYSLWSRHIESDLLPMARELGVGVVAWSPLGSGFLAAPPSALANGDFRRNVPRFQGANLQRNTDRFAPLRDLADELGITPAQLALAWLLSRGDDIVPIPGTRDPVHLASNLAAARMQLDPVTLARIDDLAPAGLAQGGALVR